MSVSANPLTNILHLTPPSRSIVLRLVSSAGTGFYYTTVRRRTLPKLSLMKYDPIVNKHVLFIEGRLIWGAVRRASPRREP
ncbi:hypothetical protein BDK51DRAFT_17508 [Blyttiomyces helicus]|uniref:Large ribosomal subunit protein bL33m n=1 Tax=Blyttiomyces helicus TaxID=388810 RepID=A0A4V1IQT2_9FUNG|nr:hypothetical protein BDK51DRAFT_17508 [Blyttiomyces helicus]|eukprot:RKO87647.1 hypothetical protein BDK51DRAFT_17508 [Blyttiomyces helicus]